MPGETKDVVSAFARFGYWGEMATAPVPMEEPAEGSDGLRDWAPWWLANRQRRQFGDWYVWRYTDELDPSVGHIMLTRTRLRDDGRRGSTFGFWVSQGQRAITISGFETETPYCAWRAASYAVDRGRAGYLVNSVGGVLDKVLLNGKAVQQFQTGKR